MQPLRESLSRGTLSVHWNLSLPATDMITTRVCQSMQMLSVTSSPQRRSTATTWLSLIFWSGSSLAYFSALCSGTFRRERVRSMSMVSTNDSALNDHIPSPGTDGTKDECPNVFYASALDHHLCNIWNLQIEHPQKDVLQHMDNIDSAFRHLLYHPTIAIIFAYIFQCFLIVLVSMIFGARNLPSWFCLFSKIHAHVASARYLDKNDPAPQQND